MIAQKASDRSGSRQVDGGLGQLGNDARRVGAGRQGEGELERRFRALCEELRALGWFDVERKRPIPTFPRRIGVVTSRTGAALQDVIDTMRRRCPAVDIAVVDVRVQGEGAAAQVAAAIRWLSADHERLGIDAILVVRGGGSIEDLWPFNEERVVRAVADSVIPLISAVGHETDTTLIDYASDRRAPTPTGAAEMALPVRAELMAQVETLGGRLTRRLVDTLERRRLELRSASGRLPKLDTLLQGPRQRLDMASQRFGGSLSRMLARKRARFDQAGGGLRSAALRREIAGKRGEVQRLAVRLAPAMERRLRRLRDALTGQARVLNSVSYESVLARGFALVTRSDGGLVRSAGALADGDKLRLRFADGERDAVAGARGVGPASASEAGNAGQAPGGPEEKHRPRIRKRVRSEDDQGNLF